MKHSGTYYSVTCLYREFDPFVKGTCRVFDDTAWSMRNGGMQCMPKYIHPSLVKNHGCLSRLNQWLQLTLNKFRTKSSVINESKTPTHIQGVENMVYTPPFVQQVVHTKDKVPTVILHTVEQLLALTDYKCIQQVNVLGFDITYIK